MKAHKEPFKECCHSETASTGFHVNLPSAVGFGLGLGCNQLRPGMRTVFHIIPRGLYHKKK